MKYSNGKDFLASSNKRILLMGLSGVGKTTTARMLPSQSWFHYSVDYRIWTHHLCDQLNDYLKSLALKEPKLKELLLADAISVEHRVHFDNLLATTVYMGMLGSPQDGGSTLQEFTDRMGEYVTGEIQSMLDIPRFIARAASLYGYPHFLVDASGSLCEIIELNNDNDEVLRCIDENCLIVYIESTKEHENELIRRAEADPKPIYYRDDFVRQELPALLKHFNVSSVESVHPKQIGAYLYPRLLAHRVPRYKKIANKYGYTISMTEVLKTSTYTDFLDLIAKTIDKQNKA